MREKSNEWEEIMILLKYMLNVFRNEDAIAAYVEGFENFLKFNLTTVNITYKSI